MTEPPHGYRWRRLANVLDRRIRRHPRLYRIALSNWTLVGLGLAIGLTGWGSGLYR